jgi:protein-S-isoprenylcysteine O-methyltransferase Ste14
VADTGVLQLDVTEAGNGKKKESYTMKEKNGEHPFGDAGQTILFVLFMLVWAADSFWLEISTLPTAYISIYVRIIVAVVVPVVALILAKNGLAVAGKKNDPGRVVSSGAFHFVRHPLYLGSILFYVCLTVLTASLLSLGVLVVIFVFYDYIARYEEKLLELRYGDEYLRYKRRTGKWIPKLRRENPA